MFFTFLPCFLPGHNWHYHATWCRAWFRKWAVKPSLVPITFSGVALRDVVDSDSIATRTFSIPEIQLILLRYVLLLWCIGVGGSWKHGFNSAPNFSTVLTNWWPRSHVWLPSPCRLRGPWFEQDSDESKGGSPEKKKRTTRLLHRLGSPCPSVIWKSFFFALEQGSLRARAGKVGKDQKVKMPSSFTITEKKGLSIRNKKGTIEKPQLQLVSTEALLA